MMVTEKLDKNASYRLTEDETYQIEIYGHDIETDWIRLEPNGLLTLKKGYVWDGATRAFEVKSFHTAAKVHDAIYKLMRMGLLPKSCRKIADQIMKRLAKEGGMGWWRHVRYGAVRLLGGIFNWRPWRF